MKRKICFPSSTSLSGGSNNSALLLARDLKSIYNNSYEPILVYPEKGPIVGRALNYHINPKFLYINTLMKRTHKLIKKSWVFKVIFFLLSIPYLFKISYFLKHENVDIIHTNDLMSALLWGTIGKVRDIPVIWHIRQEKSSKVLDSIRLWAAEKVIFVADVNKRKFSNRILGRINYDVIHNGVDVNVYKPLMTSKIKDECNLSNNTKIVGFVGYLEKRKRPEFFIEVAIKILKKYNYKYVHFIIVGEETKDNGYKKLFIDKICQEEVNKYFTFIGFRNDVNEIMAEIDVLMLTSEFKGEAFPRVVIEAMACGTPVVATEAGGVAEAVENGKSGFIVNSNDLDELAEKLFKILTDEELKKRFSDNSRQIVLDFFDSSKVTEKIVNIYESI